jgi:hypothetical protein
MADKKTNLKDAIMDLARGIESVFRKYSRSTREKAWTKITGKDGEREIKKIMVDPTRQLSTFAKLVTQKESVAATSSIRMWLDDERPMPEGFNLHVKRADEAIKAIKTGRVGEVSLDHDLGGEENGTGYDVAKFIEEAAFQGSLAPMRLSVHSANPVGANNIKKCIDNAMRFWGAS